MKSNDPELLQYVPGFFYVLERLAFKEKDLPLGTKDHSSSSSSSNSSVGLSQSSGDCSLEVTSSKSSRFYANRMPEISVSAYFDRIMRYCPVSPSTFVISLIYLDRLVGKCGKGFVNTHTIHRQVITRLAPIFQFFHIG
jgi:hypothetical protein